MVTKEDFDKLVKLLNRNTAYTETIKFKSFINFLHKDVLPYYDKSKFYLSNLAYIYRKIITIDDICRNIGEYERYPIHERDLVMLAVLSDMHRVINPFDNDLAHSSDIVDREFRADRNYYFKNKKQYDELLDRTYPVNFSMRIITRLLYDVNTLVRMEPNWYFCCAWHDYWMLHKYDLDEYNHGDRRKFKPSDIADDKLLKRLWVNLKTESTKWDKLYIPELRDNKFYNEQIKNTREALKDFDNFRNIIENNEYILYSWPV